MIAGSYTAQTAVSNSTSLNPRVLATSGLIRRCRVPLRRCAAQGGGRRASSRDDQPRLQDARTRVGLPPSKQHALASRGWSARPRQGAAGPSGTAWRLEKGGTTVGFNSKGCTMNRALGGTLHGAAPALHRQRGARARRPGHQLVARVAPGLVWRAHIRGSTTGAAATIIACHCAESKGAPAEPV